MAQVINTNIASLNAQRNLNRTGNELNIALQRLSTGLRINSAKDDAAGLAISERFTTQIRGLNQAIRNANDGISFAQTAEGALGTLGNNLQRIRELAVQAANDSNSSGDRQALNNEVQQLVAEVNRVSAATQFNGQNILDGSLATQVFQVGANQNQTISITGVDTRGSQLGAATDTGASITATDLGLLADDLTLNGVAVDLSTATTVSEVVNAINNVSADSNVTAIRATTTSTDDTAGVATLTYAANAAAQTLVINGVNIAIGASATTAQVTTAINNFTTQTGVTATNAAAAYTLSNSDGSDIVIDDSAANLFGLAVNETYSAGFIVATDVGETITPAGTDAARLGIAAADITAVDNTLNAVSVLTRNDASDALLTLDFALDQVNGLRAELGAVQTRFESTIANLEIVSENLSAARSRIQDADFAAETAALTRAQILQQAGTAILAQANALPQTVLSLLQ